MKKFAIRNGSGMITEVITITKDGFVKHMSVYPTSIKMIQKDKSVRYCRQGKTFASWKDHVECMGWENEEEYIRRLRKIGFQELVKEGSQVC